MSKLWRRLRVLFRRERFEDQLEEEMQARLEMQAEENREKSMEAKEVRYAAMRQFGNPTLLKEESHSAWGWSSVERLRQDLRYASRMIRKNPGFAVVVVLTVGVVKWN